MKNQITSSKVFINGDGPAKMFPGYKIYQHIPCGVISCDSANFQLFFTEIQKQHETTFPGTKHLEYLSKAERLLNANILDWFLKYPWNIPEILFGNWPYCGNCPYYTFFPRTVYQDEEKGDLYIRYFRVNAHKQPESHFLQIDNEFGFPAYYPSLQVVA